LNLRLIRQGTGEKDDDEMKREHDNLIDQMLLLEHDENNFRKRKSDFRHMQRRQGASIDRVAEFS